jgi:hypothetical protein
MRLVADEEQRFAVLGAHRAKPLGLDGLQRPALQLESFAYAAMHRESWREPSGEPEREGLLADRRRRGVWGASGRQP